MMKLFTLIPLIVISIVFLTGCFDGSSPDEKQTLDNIPPIPNNGTFSGKINTSDFEASHVAAGIYPNDKLPSSGVLSLSGLRIAGTDTTIVSIVLTTDMSTLATTTLYTNSGTVMVGGVYQNSSQKITGGGTGSIRLTQLDRNAKLLSGSFSFNALTFNQTTLQTGNQAISIEFSNVKYIDIKD